MLNRMNGWDLLQAYLDLADEQLEVSTELGNETDRHMRAMLERELDNMLLKLIEIKHELERR